MKLNGILSLFLSSILLSACVKKPEASFTISNANPSPGEVVTLTNTSTNAKDYVWEIDAGVFSTLESPQIVYPTSGTRTIHLTAIKGSHKSYADQQIIVKQEGKVCFWQTTTAFAYPVNVTIGNITKTITLGLASTPQACDAANCANFHLAPGNYSFTAAQQAPGIQTWNGNITVSDGGCVVVGLP
ncbi:MAG TPA: hypothetical protein VI112_09115 [Bacteroidia bacterium]|jgi:PKD repeat protein